MTVLPGEGWHHTAPWPRQPLAADRPRKTVVRETKEPKRKTAGADLAPLLKPVDIKRIARVPYKTVIQWIEIGHPRAGILPSIDLAAPGKRHSYRIRSEDWAEFQAKLTTPPKTRQHAAPPPRPRSTGKKKSGMFRY